VIPWHADVFTTHLAEALGPFTASEPIAVAIEVGIRHEAAVRRALVAVGGIGSAVVTGAATLATRRRRRVNMPVFEGEMATKPRPVVHWRQSGNGPPLLLLNGWTASGLAWPNQWLSRLEESYDVIRIDNRGSGWSRSAPWPFTIEDLADDARDVLDDSAIEPAAVLGISMGGMIAQELAIRHSDIVEKLVLVATRPPTPAHTPMSSDALRLTWGRPPRERSLREYFVTTWAQTTGDGFAAAHPQVLDELGDQIMRRITPRGGLVNQMRAIMAWHGPHRLRQITAPTTIVHGAQDPLITVDNGRRLAELIPAARYVELSGVGHLVAHEAGDSLINALTL
jgi:3-oxoadipate enol-lactonase